MTVKKKDPANDTSELQIVKWGMSTNAFRIAILVLVLSMHPVGRGILTSFGFRFPDQQKLEEAAAQAKDVHNDVAQLQADVKELKDTATHVMANNAIINSKLDTMEQTFRGFQVDFAKWKSQPQTN